MKIIIRFFRRLLVWLCLLGAVWAIGYGWFISQIPTTSSNINTPTDTIVVLTGSKGRIEYGLSLFASGKGKSLFISGVNKYATPEEVVQSAIANAEKTMHLPSKLPVTMGYKATNTIGNALEVSQWMEEQHYRSLRLVTASYHMPRSLEEFRQLMPDTQMIADPVILDNFHRSEWWNIKGSGALMLSEYHKYLAAKLRHILLKWSEDS